MTRKEVKALVMRLYDAVQESGWSSHKYTDDDWHNLYSIREVCNNVLPVCGCMLVVASAVFLSAAVFVIGFSLIMGGVSMLA